LLLSTDLLFHFLELLKLLKLLELNELFVLIWRHEWIVIYFMEVSSVRAWSRIRVSWLLHCTILLLILLWNCLLRILLNSLLLVYLLVLLILLYLLILYLLILLILLLIGLVEHASIATGLDLIVRLLLLVLLLGLF